MSKKKKLVIGALILLILVFTGALSVYARNVNAAKVDPYPAPDFALSTPAGETVRLSDFKGQTPVAIVFWASFCKGCKNEMPHIYKVASEYEESGFRFLLVNSTSSTRETREAALAYLDENQFDFKNVLLDVEGEAASLYELYTLPATVFVDRDGTVVSRYDGEITEKQLRREIKALLKN